MRADPIQWYPGHMARAMRRLADDLKLIDVAIEVVDARVPFSGSNPQLQQIVVRKRRLLVLAREDLADPQTTARWLAHFELEGRAVVTLDVKRRAGLARLVRALTEVAGEGHGAQRAIVVGIPNAGKSTVINALAGRNVARVEDRAGVTRAPQWFRLGPTLELMDTAGILVPRIATEEAQWKLAMVGAVPRTRYDPEDVVSRFWRWCTDGARYRAIPDLETYAQSRGFVRRGNVLDIHNAAWAYLKDFSDARFGRITLEEPA